MPKKTMRNLKRALPWAISALSTAGMIASALARRATRAKVRAEVAATSEEPRPDPWSTQESGAV